MTGELRVIPIRGIPELEEGDDLAAIVVEKAPGFEIDDVPTRQRWQLFLSNDGHRVYSRTKTSRRGGEVRVRILIRNRPGRDRIAASGVNTRTGTTCEGSVRY